MSAKDTFYFSHDYNARTDPKIKRLLSKHGMAGYGLYWAIIEDLYNNDNILPADFCSMAFDLRCDELTVKSIVTDFDLFIITGEFFGSLSVQRRLQERADKSKKARDSAMERWKKKSEPEIDFTEQDAENMRTHSERNENSCDSNAIKEKKVKESKEKESNEEKFNFKKALISLGVDEKIASDWLIVRKQKKAANTETAFNAIKNQIEISVIPANECIKIAVEKSWSGFKAEWLKNSENGTKQQNNSTGFTRPGYDPNNGIGNGERLSDKKRPVVFSSDRV